MDISVKNSRNQFEYTLYDKRNDIPFKVNSMPNLNSNIPNSLAYGVFYSQVESLFNANNDLNSLIKNVQNLSNKLSNPNFNNLVSSNK